jgi:hypothetical protein
MLFKVGSKVERHYENIANTFDSMCTLYLECFLPVIEELFRTKKYKPKFPRSLLGMGVGTHGLDLHAKVERWRGGEVECASGRC